MTQDLQDSPHVPIDRHEMRRCRRIQGLTQAQLAELAQVSFGYIGQIERGDRKRVSPPVFARICDALGVKNRKELIAAAEAVA